jgi:universal stress protein A
MGIYKNIVCAVDFSRYSEAACSRAIEFAKHFDAQLTLLHVVENFPEDRSSEVIAPEHIDPAIYRESQARQKLTELEERLRYNKATHLVLFSMQSAWHEIVRFAEEENVDLIVLGSHGIHGITAVLGSTATGVVNHAPCDVLAKHSQA